MRLSIAGILDRGVSNKERVALTVAVESNLAYYAVILSSYLPGRQQIHSERLSVYWFSPAIVKPGDFVILYTGPGRNAPESRPDGGTNHFYHWGLPNTVFNNSESCAILLEISTWITSPPPGV